MKRADQEDRGFHPPHETIKPRSITGTVSVVIGLAIVFLELVVLPLLWKFLARTFVSPAFSDIIEIVSLATGLTAVLALIGLGFGILGFLQFERRRDLPVVGIILNALILVAIVARFALPIIQPFMGEMNRYLR